MRRAKKFLGVTNVSLVILMFLLFLLLLLLLLLLLHDIPIYPNTSIIVGYGGMRRNTADAHQSNTVRLISHCLIRLRVCGVLTSDGKRNAKS